MYTPVQARHSMDMLTTVRRMSLLINLAHHPMLRITSIRLDFGFHLSSPCIPSSFQPGSARSSVLANLVILLFRVCGRRSRHTTPRPREILSNILVSGRARTSDRQGSRHLHSARIPQKKVELASAKVGQSRRCQNVPETSMLVGGARGNTMQQKNTLLLHA